MTTTTRTETLTAVRTIIHTDGNIILWRVWVDSDGRRGCREAVRILADGSSAVTGTWRTRLSDLRRETPYAPVVAQDTGWRKVPEAARQIRAV